MSRALSESGKKAPGRCVYVCALWMEARNVKEGPKGVVWSFDRGKYESRDLKERSRPNRDKQREGGGAERRSRRKRTRSKEERKALG